MPDWAGKAYRRTREETEAVEADARQAAINAKLLANRKKADPAVLAGIAERRTAYLAEQKALKTDAAREKAAWLETLVEQIDAAHGPEALIMGTQIATTAPEVVERLVNEMHHHIAPASAPDNWQATEPDEQAIPEGAGAPPTPDILPEPAENDNRSYQWPNSELNKKYLKLRTVRLEEVARYLDCNPEKLRTALKHLGENPSAIQYEIGKAASIGPAASVRALEARASAEEAAIRAEEEANSRVITAWEKCHISMMSWTR